MTEPDDLPRSPTGRVPKWVVEERLQGRLESTGYVPGTAPVPQPARARHRRPSVSLPAVVTAVVVVLLGWVGVRSALGGTPAAPRPAGASAASSAAAPLSGSVPNAPPAGVDEQSGRLLPAVTPSKASRVWTPFARQQDGDPASEPVRWDPCRPVRYVVRTQGAPPGGARLLAEAFREVSAATGLQFLPAGSTDEKVTAQRDVYQPDRYGERWAPVVVAWERAAENPALAADVAGQAGPTALRLQGRPAVYVTGTVELDADQLRALLATPAGRVAARAVVLHELGHLVGLGHVDDPTQLMYPKATGTTDRFGAGDLAGLAEMGKGPCAPWL